MKQHEQQTLEAISRKLDLILGLLLKQRAQTAPEKETAVSLREAGLNVEEIARALGKTPNAIRLYISRSKRR